MAHYTLEEVLEYFSSGVVPLHLSRKERKTFWKATKTFLFRGGILYKGRKRVLITEAEKEHAFRDVHDSDRGAHMGINKTITKLSTRFYFLNITDYVNNAIKKCDKCQRTECIKTVSETLTPIKSSEPWEIIGMDLIGPLTETKNGNKYCLTITDLFSKWVEAYPIKSKSAGDVAACLLSICFRFGPPKRVITDQGREFVNGLNQSIFETVETRHLITSAYHPQTNGQDERTNRTLKTVLSKLVNDNQDDWDTLLEPILFGIRTSRQESTKTTPFLAMMCREPRMFSEISEFEDHDATEDATEEIVLKRIDNIKNVYQSISANIEQAQEKQKKDHIKKQNKKCKSFMFKVGQTVLKRNNRKKDRKGQGLETDWLGPYVIISKNNYSAVLENKKGVVCKSKTSLSHLKPYFSNDRQTNGCAESVSTPSIENEMNVIGHTDPSVLISTHGTEVKTSPEKDKKTQQEKDNEPTIEYEKGTQIKQNPKPKLIKINIDKTKVNEYIVKNNVKENGDNSLIKISRKEKEVLTGIGIERKGKRQNENISASEEKDNVPTIPVIKRSRFEKGKSTTPIEQGLKTMKTTLDKSKEDKRELLNYQVKRIRNEKENKASLRTEQKYTKANAQIVKNKDTENGDNSLIKISRKEKEVIKGIGIEQKGKRQNENISASEEKDNVPTIRVIKRSRFEKEESTTTTEQGPKTIKTNLDQSKEDKRELLNYQVKRIRKEKENKASLRTEQKYTKANEQIVKNKDKENDDNSLLKILRKDKEVITVIGIERKGKRENETISTREKKEDKYTNKSLNTSAKKTIKVKRNLGSICNNTFTKSTIKQGWLTDREIDNAQRLLAQDYFYIESLQSVLAVKAAECGGYLLSVSCGTFVQIINVSNNHWITVSGNASGNIVQIYDSLGCHYTTELEFAVAVIVCTEQDTIEVQYPECLQQAGYSDCGLFSIANATAVCLGEDPSTFVWTQSKMRDHLLKCFQMNRMELFPFTRRSRPGKLRHTQYIGLCSYCHMPQKHCICSI